MDRQFAVNGNAAPAPGGLARQTSHGFAWLLMQTVGVKCVTFCGQVILAWLLVPEDFGLVALAYSVTTFIVIFQHAGVREVLVQRGKDFLRNANPAFWMSAALGAGVAVAIVAAGPAAASVYGEPDLRGMLAVLAVAALFTGLQTVPIARMQILMRFKTLALLGVTEGIVQTVMAVTFAFLGFGAYSFILPLPVVMLLKLVVLWWAARPPLGWNPELRRWPELIGATGLLVGSSFFYAATQQSASVILGLVHGTAVVGVFYFAYNLSIQIQTLFSLNLAQVILPSLSKLQEEPRRQVMAFLRVARILVLIAAPACLLLASVADPLVRLVFADRWIPAIPVLQFLCIGMAFNITGVITLNLIKAQGRYGYHFWISAGRAALYIGLITAGASWGGAVEVGAAAALAMMIYGPALMWLAIRGTGFGWREVFGVYFYPLSAAAVSATAGLAVGGMIPEAAWQYPGRIAVTAVTMIVIYVMLTRFGAPDDWREIVSRVLSFLPARYERVVSAVLLVPGVTTAREES